MKFKYNFYTNQLWKIAAEYADEIPETSQFTTEYGAKGFNLGQQHWITFTIYPTKIKVFLKQIAEPNQPIYSQKEIPLTPAWKLPLVVPQSHREIIFEFTDQDQVIKNEKGWWVKKN